jgi:hypothetical protein
MCMYHFAYGHLINSFPDYDTKKLGIIDFVRILKQTSKNWNKYLLNFLYQMNKGSRYGNIDQVKF